MKRLVLVFLMACGGSQEKVKAPEPVAETAPKPPEKKPEPVVEAPPEPKPAPIEIKETKQEAEKCEPSWGTCVTVGADRKVEARATQLIGDPAVSETKSGTTDGSKPLELTLASGEIVQIALKRKPNDKNEVTLKMGKAGKLGPEIVVDKRDGSINDFTHIGIIASESGGKAMIDIRYMR